jgi:8-oxo-dGTP pyrophosphatase MutT (NUDIX family)
MEPRPAATVVVVRAVGDAGDLEFLLLRRAGSSRFAPGFVVFPGGVLESKDPGLAERWFGDPGQASKACAIRELAEETGLVMTSRGLLEGPGHLPGEAGFPPPDPETVPEIARWVAPEFLPVRFDARFYALVAREDVRPTPDGIEIESAWWGRADDALAGLQTGDVQLMWPTFRTLEALAGCGTVEDVLQLRVEAAPPAPPPPTPR